MNSFIANDILSVNVRLLQAVAKNDVTTYQSLCADEMFEVNGNMNDGCDDSHGDELLIPTELSPEQIMIANEGGSDEDNEYVESNFRCGEMTFVTGTKVSLSYDRKSKSGATLRETRIWSHQGPKGWRMVHFFRSS
jgi:hypothetical protein